MKLHGAPSRKGPASGGEQSAEENAMAEPRLSIQKKTSTDEDRFARQDASGYSRWSSAIVIAATVIIVGMVFLYLAMHSEF